MGLSVPKGVSLPSCAPLSELGHKIDLSQSGTSERVRRLEGSGIIAGYGARINPAALGLVPFAGGFGNNR
jgi:Lrp/AsnC family leucine-responsive transcriptional regulator